MSITAYRYGNSGKTERMETSVFLRSGVFFKCRSFDTRTSRHSPQIILLIYKMRLFSCLVYNISTLLSTTSYNFASFR